MKKIKKILLIRSGEAFVIDVSPPVGFLYLVSTLRREFDADVRVLDLLLYQTSDEEVAEYAAAFGADLVGYSGMAFQADSILRLAAAIREKLPRAIQVVGGPFPSTAPEKALSQPAVDYVVCGEGERSFAELIRVLDHGGAVDEVAGIGYRTDGEIKLTPAREPIEDLDSLPFPAFDLVDFNAYGRMPRQGFVYRHRRYWTLFTSRGCPYGCIFCHNLFGRRFRYRSAENVLAEIDVLHHRHRVREFQILDDCFNLKRERALAILRGIVERKYKIALSFANGLRGDLLDEEVVDWLKRAGTFKVTVAVETGSPRLQKEIKKNIDLDKARRAIELLTKRRMMTHGFFMMGFPGETEAELQQTVEFACRSRLHTASFFHVIPFHGTELYSIYREMKQEEPDFTFPSSYFDARMARFSLAATTPERVGELVRRATFKFYLNAKRLWRILRDIPNKLQLLSLALLVAGRSLFPFLLRSEQRQFKRSKRKRLPAVTQANTNGTGRDS